MRHAAEANDYKHVTKQPPDWGYFSKLSIKLGQNYAGKPERVSAMCLHVFPAAPLLPL